MSINPAQSPIGPVVSIEVFNMGIIVTVDGEVIANIDVASQISIADSRGRLTIAPLMGGINKYTTETTLTIRK